ncbi:hypothetical protein [Frigoriglobus tundricola]|uniref:hypothetical protein n=1 Tax=Frigoriglobus tundricola TaxID=2774151 RepID=UPI001D076A6F|nr:hypothetical protein [Frigoriglobus tundricola]
MNVTAWKYVAVWVISAGAVGTGVALALGTGGPPAGRTDAPAAVPVVARNEPPAKEKPIEGDWTPKELGSPVPTAFPNLKAPDDNLAEACPLISGKKPIAVADTDATAQRLLKARINQYGLLLARLMSFAYKNDTYYREQIQCQTELIGALTELWPNEVDKRIPWLEELLISTKFNENLVRQTVKESRDPRASPVNVLTLAALTRHRLWVESTLLLWKAKAAK